MAMLSFITITFTMPVSDWFIKGRSFCRSAFDIDRKGGSANEAAVIFPTSPFSSSWLKKAKVEKLGGDKAPAKKAVVKKAASKKTAPKKVAAKKAPAKKAAAKKK